jgi:hypothetical protein
MRLIRIVWWNTGLAPMGLVRDDPERWSEASRIILELIAEHFVDMLVLGEVAANQLYQLVKELSLRNYYVLENVQQRGKLRFDTGIIYKQGLLSRVHEHVIVADSGVSSLKVAARVDLRPRGLDIPLHFFISHWPSRLHCPPDCASRHLLALRLKEAVNEVLRLPGHRHQAILLGDYNEEPFSSSLEEYLLAVRDRRLAQSRGLLYNPFWGNLGEPERYAQGKSPDRKSVV